MKDLGRETKQAFNVLSFKKIPFLFLISFNFISSLWLKTSIIPDCAAASQANIKPPAANYMAWKFRKIHWTSFCSLFWEWKKKNNNIELSTWWQPQNYMFRSNQPRLKSHRTSFALYSENEKKIIVVQSYELDANPRITCFIVINSDAWASLQKNKFTGK